MFQLMHTPFDIQVSLSCSVCLVLVVIYVFGVLWSLREVARHLERARAFVCLALCSPAPVTVTLTRAQVEGALQCSSATQCLCETDK